MWAWAPSAVTIRPPSSPPQVPFGTVSGRTREASHAPVPRMTRQSASRRSMINDFPADPVGSRAWRAQRARTGGAGNVRADADRVPQAFGGEPERVLGH